MKNEHADADVDRLQRIVSELGERLRITEKQLLKTHRIAVQAFRAAQPEGGRSEGGQPEGGQPEEGRSEGRLDAPADSRTESLPGSRSESLAETPAEIDEPAYDNDLHDDIAADSAAQDDASGVNADLTRAGDAGDAVRTETDAAETDRSTGRDVSPESGLPAEDAGAASIPFPSPAEPPAASPPPAPSAPQAAPEAGGHWQAALLGPELAEAPGLRADREALIDGLLHGEPAAGALLGELLVFRNAPADQRAQLLKSVGEAYYRWRPETAGQQDAFRQQLIAMLQSMCEQAGLMNRIELVQPGDRFDSARHHSRQKGGMEVVDVQGWVVLRENGKPYTKANVTVQ